MLLNKRQITADNLNKPTTLLTVAQLQTELSENILDYYIVKLDQSIENHFTVEGKNCFCVKPDFEQLETTGPLVMLLDKQMIIDYNVQLNLSRPTNQSNFKRKCIIHAVKT